MSGFVCPPDNQDVLIYFPTDASQTYPLLSFMHGLSAAGDLVHPTYQGLLEGLAAAGYVVVAALAGEAGVCLEGGAKDQLRAIEVIRNTEEFASRVDWSAKAGIIGHSMGSDTTGINTADAEAIAQYNLGAAAVLHPLSQKGNYSVDFLKNLEPRYPWRAHASMPVFIASGEEDSLTPPIFAKYEYLLARGPKVLAVMENAGHMEPCSSYPNAVMGLFPVGRLEPPGKRPAGWTTSVTRWMNCHLKGMGGDCDEIFSICDGRSLPLSDCASKGSPGDDKPLADAMWDDVQAMRSQAGFRWCCDDSCTTEC